jgi:hypothetical protein
MATREIRSIQALTALAFSVVRRAPGLSQLTSVRIGPVVPDANAGPPNYTWKLTAVTLRRAATDREFASAEKALLYFRGRYDLMPG